MMAARTSFIHLLFRNAWRGAIAVHRAQAPVLILAAGLVMVAPVRAQDAPLASDPLQGLPKAEVQEPEAPDVRALPVDQTGPLARLKAVRLVPSRIDVEGTHAVPRQWALDLFDGMTGREVSIGDLMAAADACTRLYREYEHALSFCYLPKQGFQDGVVRVLAVEGYVSAVHVHGDAGKLAPRIRGIAGRLVGQRPLGQRRFERQVRLLGMVPGARIAIRMTAPTTLDGGMEMHLEVKRRKFDAGAALDFNHPGLQGMIDVTLNAPTVLGDKATFSVLYPGGRGDQRYQALAYAVPLGYDGWNLRADASRYRGEPARQDGSFGRRVAQDRRALAVEYPWLLRKDRSLIVRGNAYASDQADRYTRLADGASAELQTRVRALQAGLDYSQRSQRASLRASASVTRGFDRWGASSRIVGPNSVTLPLDPGALQFTRINASLNESRSFAGFGARFDITGQYSRTRLPPSERISFGGSRFALAHDPGDAVGDRGWGTSLEFNRRVAVSALWLKAVTPYLVAQHAHVDSDGRQSPLRTLGSFGLGMRMSDQRYYTVDMTVAQPTADLVPGASREPRWNLLFSYNLR